MQVYVNYHIKVRAIAGRAYGNIGLSYESLGQYEEAVKYQRKQLDIATQIKDYEVRTFALTSLGNASYVVLFQSAKFDIEFALCMRLGNEFQGAANEKALVPRIARRALKRGS